MSKCPDCKRKKCVWIKLKSNPEKLKTEELEKVIDHNNSYINMIFNGASSAASEERMINQLTPYADELEKRRSKIQIVFITNEKPKKASKKK